MSEQESNSETVAWFGKHKGKDLSEMPSGYLRWMVESMTPRLDPKYRFHEDGRPMTEEEVDALEVRTRNFIYAAEDELVRRVESDQD